MNHNGTTNVDVVQVVIKVVPKHHLFSFSKRDSIKLVLDTIRQFYDLEDIPESELFIGLYPNNLFTPNFLNFYDCLLATGVPTNQTIETKLFRKELLDLTSDINKPMVIERVTQLRRFRERALASPPQNNTTAFVVAEEATIKKKYVTRKNQASFPDSPQTRLSLPSTKQDDFASKTIPKGARIANLSSFFEEGNTVQVNLNKNSQPIDIVTSQSQAAQTILLNISESHVGQAKWRSSPPENISTQKQESLKEESQQIINSQKESQQIINSQKEESQQIINSQKESQQIINSQKEESQQIMNAQKQEDSFWDADAFNTFNWIEKELLAEDLMPKYSPPVPPKQHHTNSKDSQDPNPSLISQNSSSSESQNQSQSGSTFFEGDSTTSPARSTSSARRETGGRRLFDLLSSQEKMGFSQIGKHSFTFLVQLSGRVWSCNHCGQKIYVNCYQCTLCNITAHKKCLDLVPANCQQKKDANRMRKFIPEDVPLSRDSLSDFNLKTAAVRKKEGWAQKLGSYTGWKKRFFRLQNTEIFYFATEDPNEIPLGQIRCLGAVSSHKKDSWKKNTLSIWTPEREYLLSFETLEEMTSWLDLVQDININDAKNKMSQVKETWDQFELFEFATPDLNDGGSAAQIISTSTRRHDEDTDYFIRQMKFQFNSDRINKKSWRISTIPTTEIPVPNDFPETFSVTIFLTTDTSYRINCGANSTIISSLQQIDLVPKLQPEQYFLKPIGSEQFLPINETKIANLIVVRESLKNQRAIEFQIVKGGDFDLGEFSPKNEEPRRDEWINVDNFCGFETTKIKGLPITNITNTFRIRILAIKDFPLHLLGQYFTKSDIQNKKVMVFVELTLFYGINPITPKLVTASIPASTSQPFWCEWLLNSTPLQNIPRETRALFSVSATLRDTPAPRRHLAWTIFTLADYKGWYRRGTFSLGLYFSNSRPSPLESAVPNQASNIPVLQIELPTPPQPIFYPVESIEMRMKKCLVTSKSDLITSKTNRMSILSSSKSSSSIERWQRSELSDSAGMSSNSGSELTGSLSGLSSSPRGIPHPTFCLANEERDTSLKEATQKEGTQKEHKTVAQNPNKGEEIDQNELSLNQNELSDSEEKEEELLLEEEEAYQKLQYIFALDCLTLLSDHEKKLVWRLRNECRARFPQESLPKLLLSVPWTNPEAVRQVNQLLQRWPPIGLATALELLDSPFPHSKAREFAVNNLNRCIEHKDLHQYLPQLIEAIRFENHHFSALALYLLREATEDPKYLGQYFFWHLKTQISYRNNKMAPRYKLLMDWFLRIAGVHAPKILGMAKIFSQVSTISQQIKNMPAPKRSEHLRTQLATLSLPPMFTTPIDPTVVVNSFNLDQCKVLDSAASPLWLTFNNIDPLAKPLVVIFKDGDDLRQDILTLEVLNLMDQLWKENGLDLRLSLYRTVSTGENQGLIQVIPNSKTTGQIQRDAGGVSATFAKNTLVAWLRELHPLEEDFQKAATNFTLSCAGYCVATYVLGIADRHNDNIMIDSRGSLFHIDFGNFLGNWMTFAGIYQRETAPFVFTPEMLQVVDEQGEKGPKFKHFVKTCCLAFNTLRKHHRLFLTLFSMMIGTGISQLRNYQDIGYIRDAFVLEKNDEQASEYFANLIGESLNTTRTLINNAIHIAAHPK